MHTPRTQRTGIVCALLGAGLVAAAQSSHELVYDRPAEYFEEAFVLGNGTLGATVYGAADTERIGLNDATFWSGEPVDPALRPRRPESLPQIRAALAAGDNRAADSLQRGLQGPFSASYEPVGELTLRLAHGGGGARRSTAAASTSRPRPPRLTTPSTGSATPAATSCRTPTRCWPSR